MGTRFFFLVQLTMNRIGNLTRMYSAICDDHTCIHIYCSVYPQLPHVMGAPWGCCGHASGLFSPSAMVRWVCNSRDSVLCARVLLLHHVFRKSGHNCLTSNWYVLYYSFNGAPFSDRNEKPFLIFQMGIKGA